MSRLAIYNLHEMTAFHATSTDHLYVFLPITTLVSADVLHSKVLTTSWRPCTSNSCAKDHPMTTVSLGYGRPYQDMRRHTGLGSVIATCLESEEEMDPRQLDSSITLNETVRLNPQSRRDKITPVLRRAGEPPAARTPTRVLVNTPQAPSDSQHSSPLSSAGDDSGEHCGHSVTEKENSPPAAERHSATSESNNSCKSRNKKEKLKRNANEHEGIAKVVALRGAREFEAHINTRHPFPDPQTAHATALRIHPSACRDVGTDTTEVPGTEHFYHTYKARASSARQVPLKEIRNLVASHYGFVDSEKKKKHNRGLATWLLGDERYAHKDMEEMESYLENKIFPTAYKNIYFGSKDRLGVIFPRLFTDPKTNTGFPLPTLAFIKLQVEFCILEWSSGVRKPVSFSRKDQNLLERYGTHLQEVEKWASGATGVTSKIRNRWHNRAADPYTTSTKPPAASRSTKTIERSIANLNTRTGETDSEDSDSGVDDESDDAGEWGGIGQATEELGRTAEPQSEGHEQAASST
ncbi:hypothetical protein VNI00_004447 [Paramarasmius palmivorus]|uniref:DUF6532 domain-containing protein n=1 Tax=Paramarasmius palmivorus TaxID=297713 RepID=A0AAW0DJ62_9AGAR